MNKGIKSNSYLSLESEYQEIIGIAYSGHNI